MNTPILQSPPPAALTPPPGPSHHLFTISDALDHPISLIIIAAAVGLLLAAPLPIRLLASTGKINAALRTELRARHLAWALLIPAIIIPIVLGAAATMLAITILSILCYREFARATGLFRETRVSAAVVLGIVALLFASIDNWYGFFVALFPLTIITIAAIAIIDDRPKGYIQRVGLGIFGFTLFGACLLHLAFIANDRDFRPIILMLLLSTQASDIAAYCTGKALGRRKLAPHTSPNKTIEGSLGALLFTTALAAILAHFIFRGTQLDTPIHLLGLGLLIAVGAQLGDLMLSSIKRDIGIKDLGVAIPGHGGFLDRFDSLILVAPAAFHYIAYFRGFGAGTPVRILTGH